MTVPGAVLAVGDPAPPTTSHKATAGFWYGLAPVVLGVVLGVLEQATTLFAGAPSWVFTTVAVLLILLAPVASYVGVYRTPNRLTAPVQLLPATAPDGVIQ